MDLNSTSFRARSLATTVRRILDLLFLASVLAVILVIAGLVAGPMTGLAQLSWAPTAHFRFEPPSAALVAAGAHDASATLLDASGRIRITGNGRIETAVGLLFCAAMLCLAAFVLENLRRFFSTIEVGNPFVPDNTRRIRHVGLAVLAAELGRALFDFVEPARVAAGFASPLLKLHAALELQVSTLLAGVILLVIAEVFRLGSAMKEEQDLTI